MLAGAPASSAWARRTTSGPLCHDVRVRRPPSYGRHPRPGRPKSGARAVKKCRPSCSLSSRCAVAAPHAGFPAAGVAGYLGQHHRIGPLGQPAMVQRPACGAGWGSVRKCGAPNHHTKRQELAQDLAKSASGALQSWPETQS